MKKEQLAEVRKQLRATKGIAMIGALSKAIDEAIENDEAVKPLFDKYYECSLKHFGVKPLTD